MSKTESIIDGFEFADLEEAMQAAKETEGVRYIRSRLDMENPEMVLQMYNKMVSQEMFETAVGVCYLKELQNYLYDSPVIAENVILPIRVQHFIKEEKLPEKEKEAPLPETKEVPQVPKLPKITESTQARGKIKNIDYKVRSNLFGITSIILALCVILMFIIMGTSGTPTILNYENKLIDKYETWEQELEQRETAVKERERQLGQN